MIYDLVISARSCFGTEAYPQKAAALVPVAASVLSGAGCLHLVSRPEGRPHASDAPHPDLWNLRAVI